MGSATFKSEAAHITTTTSLSAFEIPDCKGNYNFIITTNNAFGNGSKVP
jgi:hypothetical protein